MIYAKRAAARAREARQAAVEMIDRFARGMFALFENLPGETYPTARTITLVTQQNKSRTTDRAEATLHALAKRTVLDASTREDEAFGR